MTNNSINDSFISDISLHIFLIMEVNLMNTYQELLDQSITCISFGKEPDFSNGCSHVECDNGHGCCDCDDYK